jgi:hypothetical protein
MFNNPVKTKAKVLNGIWPLHSCWRWKISISGMMLLLL